MTARPWRLGDSWSSKDPTHSPLVTIVEYDPAETPDKQGRRPSDRLVGSLLREDAERAVAAVEVEAFPRRFILGPGITDVDRELRDLLGELWLYVNWRYCTKQLMAEQKELWASCVEGWSAELNEGSDEKPVTADRWWLCPTCGIRNRDVDPSAPHEHCSYDDEAE